MLILVKGVLRRGERAAGDEEEAQEGEGRWMENGGCYMIYVCARAQMKAGGASIGSNHMLLLYYMWVMTTTDGEVMVTARYKQEDWEPSLDGWMNELESRVANKRPRPPALVCLPSRLAGTPLLRVVVIIYYI